MNTLFHIRLAKSNATTMKMLLALCYAIPTLANFKDRALKPSSRSSCLEEFLDKYYLHSHNVLITSNENDDLNLRGTFYKVDEEYLEKFVSELKIKPNSFTILPQSLRSLDTTMNTIRKSDLYSPTVEVLVLVDEGDIDRIAQTMWANELMKAAIILNRDNSSTFFTIAHRCGQQVAAQKLFECYNYKESPVLDLRKNTVRNFAGCPIYAIWSAVPPFVIDINSTFPGIFVEFVTATEVINNRKVVFRPQDDVYLQDVQSGYYFGSVLEDFEDGYADLYVGPLDSITMALFDLSPLLLDNGLHMFVPRLTDRAVLMQTVYRSTFCIALIVTFVILWLMFTCLSRQGSELNVSHNLLTFLALTIGFAYMPTVPKYSSLKFLLGHYMLLSLVITITIQAYMVSRMSTVHYLSPILDLKSLVESKIPVKLMKSISLLFTQNNDTYNREIFNSYVTLDDVNMLVAQGMKALKEKNFATIVDVGFFLMRPACLKTFSAFEIYSWKLHMGMPKNHPYYEQFHSDLTRTIEYGILSKFLELYKFKYALEYNIEIDKSVFKISLVHVGMVMRMLIYGHLAATGVLFLELLIKSKFVRKILSSIKKRN